MEPRLKSKNWPLASESSRVTGANAEGGRSPERKGKAAWGHQAGECWRNQSEEQGRYWLQRKGQSCVRALEAAVTGRVLCEARRAPARSVPSPSLVQQRQVPFPQVSGGSLPRGRSQGADCPCDQASLAHMQLPAEGC